MPSKKSFALICLLLGFYQFVAFGQHSNPHKISLHGYVRSKNGEPLTGVIINLVGKQIGENTDQNGYFEFNLLPGIYTMHFEYIGYKSTLKTVSLTGRMNFTIHLADSLLQTNEIIVTANRHTTQVKNLNMGVQKLDMETLKKLPSF